MPAVRARLKYSAAVDRPTPQIFAAWRPLRPMTNTILKTSSIRRMLALLAGTTPSRLIDEKGERVSL
jgi:hypothetical protein